MNRAHIFVKNILQNSKQKKEKFVKSKKMYNEMVSKNKNFNLIIKRNYGTYPPKLKFKDNNNNNNNNNELLYFILALTSYHITKKFVKNNK